MNELRQLRALSLAQLHQLPHAVELVLAHAGGRVATRFLSHAKPTSKLRTPPTLLISYDVNLPPGNLTLFSWQSVSRRGASSNLAFGLVRVFKASSGRGLLRILRRAIKLSIVLVSHLAAVDLDRSFVNVVFVLEWTQSTSISRSLLG